MRRMVLFALGLLVISHLATAAAVQLTSSTVIRFATLEESRNLLGSSDTFTRQMSRYDRRMRMHAQGEPGEADYLQFAADQARPWDPRARAMVERDLLKIQPILSMLKLRLPETVLLVRSTGKEEGGMPYTRLNAIIIPQSFYNDHTLVHELFHVMTRHDPALRSRLFSVIGFTRCEPVELPAPLKDLAITNPDSPLLDHYIWLGVGDRAVPAVPLLYAQSADYDVLASGSYTKYLWSGDLAIGLEGGRWKPCLADGAPVFVSASKDYVRQVGRIAHEFPQPEEILACNFETFIFQPELIGIFRERFKAFAVPSGLQDGGSPNTLSASPPVDAITSATADGPPNLKILEAMEEVFGKPESRKNSLPDS